MSWSDQRQLIETTIRQAGDLLRRIAEQPLKVISSIGKDIKLDADRQSERLVIDLLRAASPHPILAEETGEHGDRFDGPFWVIDPLDGTLNYSRGIPICCVSIALMEGNEPRAGQSMISTAMNCSAPPTAGGRI